MTPVRHIAAAAAAVCCAIAPNLAHAADPFSITFNATSTAGKPVVANVEVFLYGDATFSEILADGTQHRQFTGSSMGLPWNVKEGNDEPFYAASQSNSPFTVDVYLKAGNTSSLSLRTQEGPGGGSTYAESSHFSLDLTCQCSALFTDTLSPQTFARYDTLQGLAEAKREWFYDMPDGSTSYTVEHQLVEFSAAVPEPSAVGLVLAGLVVASGIARRKTRQSV